MNTNRMQHSRFARPAGALRLLVAVPILMALVANAPEAQAQNPYRVVVNSSSSVQSLSRSEVSRLFLKKTTSWDNGATVMPVDLPDESPVRAAFSRAVHGKPVAAINVYWQRLIFAGQGVPPVEKANDREVLEYVAANPNAIGYVSANAQVGGSVRAVTISGS